MNISHRVSRLLFFFVHEQNYETASQSIDKQPYLTNWSVCVECRGERIMSVQLFRYSIHYI